MGGGTSELLGWHRPLPEASDVEELLDEVETRPASALARWAWLGVAYGLGQWASAYAEEDWWAAWRRLWAAWEHAPPADTALDAWVREVEFAWATVSLWKPAPSLARRVASVAKRLASRNAKHWLDGDGLPVASQWPDVWGLLGAWTRALLHAESSGFPAQSRSATDQYGWLVREALRLVRGDRTPKGLLAEPAAHPIDARVVIEALRLGGDNDDWAIARRLLGRALPRRGDGEEERPRAKDLPEASNLSEWAGGAVLRSSWRPKHLGLFVGHDGTRLWLELEYKKRLLLAGDITASLMLDETPEPLEGEWCPTCSFHEDDVWYLEWECTTRTGWRIQRQIVAALDAKWLLFADAVLAPEDGTACQVRYRWQVPLAVRAGVEPLEETCDAWLVHDGTRMAWIAPLEAPEWRRAPSDVACVAGPDHLGMTADRHGRALFLPIVLDLHRGRLREARRTWRPLTVARDLRKVPRDEAVGYRIQAGRAQWLVYRSLGPVRMRTVLGRHLDTEFLVGRFRPNGDVEPYVEVESVPADDPS